MKLEIVFIKWVDTISDPESVWKNKEDTDDFFERDDNVVEEVGFVWSEDDDYIHLVDSWMPGEIPMSIHRMKIPKRWILKRKLLGYSEQQLEE